MSVDYGHDFHRCTRGCAASAVCLSDRDGSEICVPCWVREDEEQPMAETAQMPKVIVTDDDELKCPDCGFEGPMFRIATERVVDRVWLDRAMGGLDSKNLDVETLSTADYECGGCNIALDFDEVS